MTVASLSCDAMTCRLVPANIDVSGNIVLAKLAWIDAVFLEQIPESRPARPCPSGSAYHIATILFEKLSKVNLHERINNSLFGYVEALKSGSFRLGSAPGELDSPNIYRGILGHYDCLLYPVLEFPDISRPEMRGQAPDSFSGKSVDRFVVFSGISFCEMLDQNGNVLPSLSQRRHMDRNDIQPVKQVLPECTLIKEILEVSIRRSYHSYVGLVSS